MNLKLENFILFLTVATGCIWTVLSFDPKCPPLRLVNGRSRYQWRGRSVRFNCMRGYQLVGVKYATCVDGKWDVDVPICVKYGCRVPSTIHVNGQFMESYRGAVVKIVCNPGYSLIGSPKVYCNGIRWNDTFPACRVTNTNPSLSCNFEEEDLCGWSQDPMHDFDWKRRNDSIPSGDSPGDTVKNNSRGYYMYIESSSPMTENDTVRLFSPVYSSEHSNGTCFKFLYRMHGNTTGFLKVYVKPEGTELWNLIPSFWIYDDQGTSWIETSFLIESMVTPFQIVVEGGRGPGPWWKKLGDIAFDDVRLLAAEECASPETISLSSSSEATFSYSPGDFVFSQTCSNQCGKVKLSGTSPDMGTCDCDENCDREGTCCYDYFDYCTFTTSTTTPTARTTQTNAITSESTSSPSTIPSIEPESHLPSPSPSLKHFNNESNEINPEKPLAQIPPHTIPNRTSNDIPRQQHLPISRTTSKPAISRPKITTSRNDTDSKTVISATKTSNQEIPKVALPKPATSRPKSQKVPANGAEVNATWNEISRMDVRPGLGGRAKAEVVLKRTSVTSSSTATTPARGFKSSNPNNIKLPFLEKPSRPNLSNDSPFTKGKPKEVSGKEPPQAIKIDKNSGNGGVPIKEIVEFGGAALLVLVVMLAGFFWFKRRGIRKTERDNMVEDSDSIVYEMDSSTLGSEYHSLVCIRPGGLRQSL